MAEKAKKEPDERKEANADVSALWKIDDEASMAHLSQMSQRKMEEQYY